jgi:hypothetical protein
VSTAIDLEGGWLSACFGAGQPESVMMVRWIVFNCKGGSAFIKLKTPVFPVSQETTGVFFHQA